MRQQHLKTELFWRTLLSIIAIVLIVSSVASVLFYRSSKENYLKQNERLLSVMNEQAKHFLIHPEEELKLVESTLATSNKKSALQSEVLFILRRFSYIYRIEHLDQHGMIIETYPQNSDIHGIDYSRNPVYTSTKAKKTFEIAFGGTFIDPVTEHPSMTITMKARDNTYIVGYLNISQLSKAFASSELSTITYAILDENGHFLLHPDTDVVKERQVNSHFTDIEQGNIQSGDIVDYNGKSAIVQFKEIPATGWLLVIYQDLDEMISPISTTILIVLLAFIIIAIASSISLNSVLSKVEVTLVNFINMTKTISKGHYTVNPYKDGYVEFQELYINFQQMVNEIEVREEEINLLNTELEKNYLKTVFLLAKTIEAKDSYTGDHCERVKHYALIIGEKIGLSKKELSELEQGSLLHDIGKLKIPESVLTKPGKLTDQEYNLVKNHSRYGYELIKEIPKIKGAKDIVLYHHERIDGKGYPLGLKGDEIPLLARIVCIADAFDAMLSQRVYRDTSHSLEEAIQELKTCKGQQFDAYLVDQFIEALNENMPYNKKEQ